VSEEVEREVGEPPSHGVESDTKRAALRTSIWNVLGMDRQSTRGVVRANADVYVRDLDDDGEDSALEGVAIATVSVVSASYDLRNPIVDG
jgi:hypothetical protein